MTNDQLVKVLAEVKTCAETGSALVLGPGAVHNLWLAIQAIGAAHEPAGDPLALAIVEEVIRQHPQIECKGGNCPETMWCEQEAECLWTRWNK